MWLHCIKCSIEYIKNILEEAARNCYYKYAGCMNITSIKSLSARKCTELFDFECIYCTGSSDSSQYEIEKVIQIIQEHLLIKSSYAPFFVAT